MLVRVFALFLICLAGIWVVHRGSVSGLERLNVTFSNRMFMDVDARLLKYRASCGLQSDQRWLIELTSAADLDELVGNFEGLNENLAGAEGIAEEYRKFAEGMLPGVDVPTVVYPKMLKGGRIVNILVADNRYLYVRVQR